MRVVVEGNASVRMATLTLRDLWRGARLEQDCGVHVPESMN